MAGMFYSLEEVIKKLGITQERIKEMVSQGKLREFETGPDMLYKVDEVDALASGDDTAASKPADQEQPETAEAKEALEPEQNIPQEEPEISLSDTSEASIEPNELTDADTIIADADINILSETELGNKISEDTFIEQPQAADDELSLISDKPEITEEDLLAEIESETQKPSVGSGSGDLLDEDLLGQTKISDDQLDTADSGKDMPASDTTGLGDIGESGVSLEEIEQDINLDSFGSGSGLLDLSLQADDTSLGGILDEIYTSEEDKGKGGDAMDIGTIGTSADQLFAETADAGVQAPVVMPAYSEPEPDTMSNLLGILLFLALLSVIYTIIITVAGLRGVMPVILTSVQGIIWYIVIGLTVASLLIVGLGFMLSSSSGAGVKKVKARKPAKMPKKIKKAKG